MIYPLLLATPAPCLPVCTEYKNTEKTTCKSADGDNVGLGAGIGFLFGGSLGAGVGAGMGAMISDKVCTTTTEKVCTKWSCQWAGISM